MQKWIETLLKEGDTVLLRFNWATSLQKWIDRPMDEDD
ncbi:hypothetical protein ASZ90_011683 [hydrocarbon metagenome]|uniref:Uncharacterized protein n=1 Tax=hydrocarbon metagenome TaxID=938273 RepID=A0A0W8FE35_9ZZZZ